jgi:hypothetical protein
MGDLKFKNFMVKELGAGKPWVTGTSLAQVRGGHTDLDEAGTQAFLLTEVHEACSSAIQFRYSKA